MKVTITGWLFCAAAASLVSIYAGGCGSQASNKTSSSAGLPEAGADGMSGGATTCRSNADCMVDLPATIPANCATGTCNTLQGVCAYVAKDEDGDGHPAANCKSTNGVTIVVGDDCNDQDPNLYPGHPESCSTLADGGAPAGTLCSYGEITCSPNGLESACNNANYCQNQACVSGTCRGECAPGQTQCSQNQTGVLSCQPDGTWSGTVLCANQTCIPSRGACEGVCAPKQTQCSSSSNGVQNCQSDGTWGPAQACTNSTCMGGECSGSCASGQTTCSGNNSVETCVNGRFANPTACANKTCVNGACLGECAIGDTQCSGNTLQTCDNTGHWGNTDCTSLNKTCGGSPAACSGSCYPNETQGCGNCNKGTQTCSNGGYGACQDSPCSPDSAYNCNTCSSLSPFVAGTEICSSTCDFNGVVCNPTGIGMQWSAAYSGFDHNVGSAFTAAGEPGSCGSDAPIIPWQAPGSVVGYLQYGPYVTLPPGNYTANFHVLCELNSSAGNFQGLTLDVTTNSGATEIAQTTFVPNCNAVCYQAATLPFTISSCTSGVEFRMYTPGEYDILTNETTITLVSNL